MCSAKVAGIAHGLCIGRMGGALSGTGVRIERTLSRRKWRGAEGCKD